MARFKALGLCEVGDKIAQEFGVEASVAVAADFLTVRQNGENGVLRVFCSQNGRKGRVGAYAVVVAVSANHAAVKANIDCFGRRNELDVSGKKVFFRHAERFVQNSHDVELYKIFALLSANRAAADENIQVLA